ncbi:MAG TPA: hypothetical protein DIT16_04900 [Clostridium sp.]|nr:hypothetical protein [Clostridium sp.]
MIKKGNNKKKKGFTLIELVIVLAVMAIIALIAIPNFSAVRQNSKVKADKQSCETVKRTVLMLTADEQITVTTNTKVKYNAVSGTVTEPVDKKELDDNEIKIIQTQLKDIGKPQQKIDDNVANTYVFTIDPDGKISEVSVEYNK